MIFNKLVKSTYQNESVKNITLAVDRQIEYKYLGKQMLGNQNTSVYQTVERETGNLPNTKRETFPLIQVNIGMERTVQY
jgi:hypothetical protein